MSEEYYASCRNEDKECYASETVDIEYDLCDNPISCDGDSVVWEFTGECSACGHTHTLTVYATAHSYEVEGE
ncbi:hypothetical protein OAA43_00155 [bacterium]|jgi:hypothetical protein|nr:hypothetical protein [bacterium]